MEKLTEGKLESFRTEDDISPLESGFIRLEKQLDELKIEFKGKIKYDEKKDKMIDELHLELRGYRENLVLASIKPLMLDLIQIIETQEKTMELLYNKPLSSLYNIELLRIMDGFSVEIEDALYRQGIDNFESEGEAFDNSRHKIIRILDTFEASKNRIIYKSVRKGYILEDKVIKKENVEVLIFKEPHEKNGDALI